MLNTLNRIYEVLVPIANTIVNDNQQTFRWYIPVLPRVLFPSHSDMVELLSDTELHLVQFGYDYDSVISIEVYAKENEDDAWGLVDTIMDEQTLSTVREFFESQNQLV